jgi:hypothetical protein
MAAGDGSKSIPEECWDHAVMELALRQIQLLKMRRPGPSSPTNARVAELGVLLDFNINQLMDDVKAQVKKLLEENQHLLR